MTNPKHSTKYAKSKIGQVNKNTLDPRQFVARYGFRFMDIATIRSMTGMDSTGMAAAVLLYRLQRIMTHEALHEEDGFVWWVRTGKELAADACLTYAEYRRAITRLKKLDLIETRQGYTEIRRSLNCTKIRIRYETLYKGKGNVSEYVENSTKAELETIEAKCPPYTYKKFETVWRLSLPDELAKDFHGFSSVDRKSVNLLRKKVDACHPDLMPAIKSALQDWQGYLEYLTKNVYKKYEDCPHTPDPLFIYTYSDTFVNCHWAELKAREEELESLAKWEKLKL